MKTVLTIHHIDYVGTPPGDDATGIFFIQGLREKDLRESEIKDYNADPFRPKTLPGTSDNGDDEVALPRYRSSRRNSGTGNTKDEGGIQLLPYENTTLPFSRPEDIRLRILTRGGQTYDVLENIDQIRAVFKKLGVRRILLRDMPKDGGEAPSISAAEVSVTRRRATTPNGSSNQVVTPVRSAANIIEKASQHNGSSRRRQAMPPGRGSEVLGRKFPNVSLLKARP